jgi:hypothetical protein
MVRIQLKMGRNLLKMVLQLSEVPDSIKPEVRIFWQTIKNKHYEVSFDEILRGGYVGGKFYYNREV